MKKELAFFRTAYQQLAGMEERLLEMKDESRRQLAVLREMEDPGCSGVEKAVELVRRIGDFDGAVNNLRDAMFVMDHYYEAASSALRARESEALSREIRERARDLPPMTDEGFDDDDDRETVEDLSLLEDPGEDELPF